MQTSLKHLVSIILPLAGGHLWAQNALGVHWSEAFPMQRNDHHHRIIAADSTGIYVLGLHNNYAGPFDPGTPVLDKIGWDFKRISTQKLAGFQETDSIHYKDIVSVAGHRYLLYNREVSKSRYIFYAQSLDYQNNQLVNAPLAISDTLHQDFSGEDYGIAGDKISFVRYRGLQNFTVSVHNRNLKLLWKKNYSFPLDPRTTYLDKVHLTRSGAVIMFMHQFDEPLKNGDWRERPNEQRRHFAFLLRGNEQDGKLYKLDCAKRHVSRMSIEESGDGMLYFTAFYSEKEFNRAYGTLQFVLDPFTDKVTALAPVPFPEGVIPPDQRAEKSRSINLPDYLNYFPNLRTITFETLPENEDFIIKDAIVLQFDSAFQNPKSSRIPKNQALSSRDESREYSSLTFSIHSSGESYYLYNDHLVGKDAKIRIGHIDGQGEFSSMAAAPPTETNALIVPASLYQFGRKVLVVAESPLFNRYYLGEITLP